MAIAGSVSNISSSFVISASWTPGQGTCTITNPGRSFRVVQILCTGANLAVITTRKNTGAGATVGVCTLATGDLDSFPSVISSADADFLASDNIHITVGTANATSVAILCVATGGGEALTTAET